jgi:hypothetical protein
MINNDVKDFAKGIKRDRTQYEILKDERQFETWYLGFIIMARSHDILDVFDDTYVPTADDKALFEKKQYYAYTVLHHTLKIDMGKIMVRKHKDTGDAQKLWRKSTKAQILSTDLLSWITSTKYDNSWRGPTQNYILYWLNCISEYDSYCTTANTMSDEIKLQLLQNVVKDVSSLRQVRINADHAVAEGRPKMTYQQYIPLLLSAAEAYDDVANGQKIPSRRQQVDASEIVPHNQVQDEYDDDNVPYNVDTYEYLANVTSQRAPIQSRKGSIHQSERNSQRNFIPREDWLRIPEDVRKLLTSGQKSDRQDRPNREIHQLSLASDGQSDDAHAGTPHDNDYTRLSSNDSILINAMVNKTQLTSEQIDNVYNTVNNGNNQRSVHYHKNNSSTTNVNDSEDFITYQGTNYYRKINILNITYHINTKNTNLIGYSLVDRGANGGLFGSDVRILNHTMRKVTITCINNHQVGDLPICTGAGYSLTQHGPVIFIMHQYAYLGQGKIIHSSCQLESFKIIVDDRSRQVGGKQRMVTPDGYFIPLTIIHGPPIKK